MIRPIIISANYDECRCNDDATAAWWITDFCDQLIGCSVGKDPFQLDEASSNGSGGCGRKLEEYINQVDPRDVRREEEADFEACCSSGSRTT